jgi:hypothetical protein
VSTCACGRPVTDATCCQGCANRFAVDLGDVPWLVGQLTLTITRQAVLDQRNGPRSAETPVAFHLKASDVLDRLTGTLTSWVRLVSEERGHGRKLPAPGPSSLAGWLLAEVEWIRHHDAGAEAFDEIGDRVRDARHVVDTPRNRATFPVCPCPETDCPGEVRAYIPRADDDRPHLTCTADPGHTWPGEQWLHFGKRVLGREVA